MESDAWPVIVETPGCPDTWKGTVQAGDAYSARIFALIAARADDYPVEYDTEVYNDTL